MIPDLSPIVERGLISIIVSILVCTFLFFVYIVQFYRTNRYVFLIPVIAVLVFFPLLSSFGESLFIKEDSFRVEVDVSNPSCGTYIAHTNPALLQYLGTVHCYKARRGIEALFWGDDTSAQYFAVSREIYLIHSESWWHELGHHIWHWLLTDDQRSDYERVYDSGTGNPTVYSRQSVEEDFAESFAFYYAPSEFISWNGDELLTEELDVRRETLIDFYVGKIIERYYLEQSPDDMISLFEE